MIAVSIFRVVGNVGSSLSSTVWRYGRKWNGSGCPFADTRYGIFSAQFLLAGEGGVWGRLDSFNDRVVFGGLSMFSDFACRAFGGICGFDCAAYVQKDAAGQRDTICAFLAFGNGGGGVLLRKRAKGSMTLEASFIITWTVFLFVLLIYLSFESCFLLITLNL